MRIRILLFLILLFLCSCAKDPAETGFEPIDIPDDTTVNMFADHVPGWVTVKFRSLDNELNTEMTRSGGFETGIPELDAVIGALGATKLRRTFEASTPYARELGMHLFYEFYVGEEMPITRAVQDFANLDFVELVELIPNVHHASEFDDAYYGLDVWEAAATLEQSTRATGTNFNDPLLYLQWHYHNDGSLGSSFLSGADINLFKAWEVTTGRPDVVVAVIDGGVNYEHPDIAQNMWVNPNPKVGEHKHGKRMSASAGAISGYDILPMSHGTHCAGTIAAVNNNGIGIGGVAGGNGSANSGVRVMSIQMFYPTSKDDPYGDGGDGSTTSSGAAQALEAAGTLGAHVASMSLSSTSGSAAYRTAITYFNNADRGESSPMKGGIVIAAASNNGLDEDRYPAAYDNVISVAWLTPSLTKHSSSNYSTTVNISAPGGQTGIGPNRRGGILSLAPIGSKSFESILGEGYSYKQGTSMATPHVAGVAALVISACADNGITLTHDELWDALLEGTRNVYKFNPRYIGKLGTGYIDANLAIRKALGLEIFIPDVEGVRLTQPYNGINLFWNAAKTLENDAVEKYGIFWSTSPLDDVDLLNAPSTVHRMEISNKVGGTYNDIGNQLSHFFSDEVIDMGLKYYLAIVSYDDTGRRSEPAYVETSESDPEFPSLSVVSNSFSDFVYLTGDTKAVSKVPVRIMNYSGHKVFETQVEISSYKPVRLDMSKLAPGVYTLIYTSGGANRKITLVKR